MPKQAKRSPRNKTLTLTDTERHSYAAHLLHLHAPTDIDTVLDHLIHQDALVALDLLPDHFVDLLFADPPYNLTKTFGRRHFSQMPDQDYEAWLDSWISKLPRLLKSTASIYICSDWRSSASLQRVLQKYFIVRNRITWEREKGRGAKYNWKNCAEDIWFCTVSEDYVFNVEAVKLKRRVLAPYTRQDGTPKDWSGSGKQRFRLTHPSNLWTDLTVPFWSMSENTPHPTQKPEKLLAKVLLASTHEGDTVLDPFLGSGTTAVVAEKLNRHYVGIEINETYCCFAEKRLAQAADNPRIQGYTDGYFWERNTLAYQKRKSDASSS